MSWKIESPHDQMLHLAALKGDLGKVRVILDSGRVYVDVRDADGTTPLMLAVANNHVTCVTELLEQGADINARRKISGATALHYAGSNGSLDMVKILMNFKPQFDLTCNKGGTPLMVACQNNHLQIVKYLRKKGASVDNRMMDGSTAVFLACQEGHFHMLKFLVKEGADLTVTRLDGTSPVWIASQMGHTEIVAQLIFAGAETDVPRDCGATPLFKACQKGYFEICELLLRQNPNLGLLKNGYSPLHAAAFNDHMEIAQLLLNSGADSRLRDLDGLTPSELAFRKGHPRLAKIIATWTPVAQRSISADNGIDCEEDCLGQLSDDGS